MNKINAGKVATMRCVRLAETNKMVSRPPAGIPEDWEDLAGFSGSARFIAVSVERGG